MNTDIRVSTSFYEHHKVWKLARRIGVEGCFSLVILWCGAAKMKPDGVLNDMTNEDIAVMSRWSGDADQFVTALLDCRLLDRLQDGTLAIHDWEDHNAFAAGAMDRRLKAKKAAAARYRQEGNDRDPDGGGGEKKRSGAGQKGRNASSASQNDCGPMHAEMGHNDPEACVFDSNACVFDSNDCVFDGDDSATHRNDRGQNDSNVRFFPENANASGASAPEKRNDSAQASTYDCDPDRNDCDRSGKNASVLQPKTAKKTASVSADKQRNQVFVIDCCPTPDLALLDSKTSNAPSPSPSRIKDKDKHGDCASLHREVDVVRVERAEFIQAVVRSYAAICPELPQPEEVKTSSGLFQAINARCRNNRERRSLSWWVRYFARVSRSDWLMGRKSDWRANALWLTRPANMEKVLMGSYDSRASPASAKGMSGVSQSGTFEARGGFFDDAKVSGS